MPTQDGLLDSRDLCDGSVLERTLADESVGSLKIQKNLQSDNFVTGTSGWEINRDTGSVEFQDATIRGTLNADDIVAGTLDASVVSVTNLNASNITTGTLSAARIAADSLSVDKLAAGTIGTHAIILTSSPSSLIRSGDYVAGTQGWRIQGNGDAEFNDVVVRGDLVSGNWDGTDPPNLSTGADAGATAGWAFDSSAGSAQFEGNLYVVGSMFVGESDTDDRIEFTDGVFNTIRFYHEGNGTATLNADNPGFVNSTFTSNNGSLQLVAATDNNKKGVTASVRSPATGIAGFQVTDNRGSTSDTHYEILMRALPVETDTDGMGVIMPTSTTADALWAEIGSTRHFTVDNNGNVVLNGELDLQDSGVTEWTIRANTSDNFQILDDDGTARVQIDQNAGITIRADNGDRRMVLNSTTANFDVDNGQTFVLVLPVKTTTGQATAVEGAMVVNTEGTIRELRLYANGSWRTIASW